VVEQWKTGGVTAFRIQRAARDANGMALVAEATMRLNLFSTLAVSHKGNPMVQRSYVHGTWQKDRSFSPAVVTKGGGRTVWLAGHGGSMDKNGNPFVGDFGAQVRRTFEYLGETMKEAGGTLDDIVTMTVFIIDSRYGREFVDIRKEFFKEGHYPGSMLVTCAGFAHPGMMIEIQGIAVLD